MCFARLWSSGFLERRSTALLLIRIGTASIRNPLGKLSSLIKFRNHTTSFVASDAAIYSASMVLRAIKRCFFNA